MNNFYTITKSIAADNSDYTFFVALNKTHRIYEGHFPQQPVVPGVCMIQMIREMAEKTVGSPLMFSNISNLKFLSLVVPTVNGELTIKVALEAVEGGYGIKASIGFEDKTFLSLKGNLSAVRTSSGTEFSPTDKVL